MLAYNFVVAQRRVERSQLEGMMKATVQLLEGLLLERVGRQRQRQEGLQTQRERWHPRYPNYSLEKSLRMSIRKESAHSAGG